MKPRGRTGNAGSSRMITVRLDSSQQHEAIHRASRGRGVSVNTFCLVAILDAAEQPNIPALTQAIDRRVAEQELAARQPKPRTKAEILQSVQSTIQMTAASDPMCDPFDFISLKELSNIAKAADLDEAKAFRVMQLFADAVAANR
jgi:hypothetical protein